MGFFSSIYHFIFRRSRRKKNRYRTLHETETATPHMVKLDEQNDDTLIQSIKLPRDQHIFTALKERGLLVEPRFPKSLGIHLIPDGEVGVALKNGHPRFLKSGGRHTLWSPFNKYLGKFKIDEALIEIGSIQILTVPQGEIALTVKNGRNIILEQGRYILEMPHRYHKSVSLDDDIIHLGTYHRIRIPDGHVGIAYQNNKQCIIAPPASEKKGIFEINSQRFKFIETKSVQLKEMQLDPRGLIGLKVGGLIRYKVVDPKQAFFGVADVENALKLQAESILNSIFAKIPLEEFSTGVSAANVSGHVDLKATASLINRITDEFVQECSAIVAGWGVELQNLNILTLEYDEKFLKVVQESVQRSISTKTELAVVENNNKIALAQTERERKQILIRAEAAAKARKIEAQAKADAAAILSKHPIAERLAMTAAIGDALSTIGPRMIMANGVSEGRLQQLFYANAIDSGQTLFGSGNKPKPVTLRRLSSP